MSEKDHEEMEAVTEETIASNLLSYRSYVESCVQIIDLVVYFKEFTDDQRKHISRQSKSNYVEATRQAFEVIINMKNVPNKYQLLLHALEAADYPKVVGVLKGILIPVHNKHRQMLKDAAHAIFRRMSVCEILPILYEAKVLDQNDVDVLKSAERTQSRGIAATELLFYVPNRNQNWFELFLSALITSGQKELAEIIDRETTEKLEAAALLGIKSPVATSSLQLSIKKQTAMDCSETDLKRGEIIRNLEKIKMAESQKANIHKKERESHDFEEEQSISRDQNARRQETSLTNCTPCKRRDIEARAKYVCSSCLEHLCCTCEEYHRSFGFMKNHKTELLNEGNESLFKVDDILVCETCEKLEADNFCENHNDVICLSCCQKVHEECATFKIGKLNEHMLSKVRNIAVNKAKVIDNKLDDLKRGFQQESKKLQRTKDMCFGQILLFFTELREFLESLKSNTLKSLAQIISIQKSAIDKGINVCSFTSQEIDTLLRRSITDKNMPEDGNKMLVEAVKMLRYLKQVEKDVETMQKQTCFSPVEFVRNEDFEKLKLDVTDLGAIHIKH